MKQIKCNGSVVMEIPDSIEVVVIDKATPRYELNGGQLFYVDEYDKKHLACSSTTNLESVFVEGEPSVAEPIVVKEK